MRWVFILDRHLRNLLGGGDGEQLRAGGNVFPKGLSLRVVVSHADLSSSTAGSASAWVMAFIGVDGYVDRELVLGH